MKLLVYLDPGFAGYFGHYHTIGGNIRGVCRRRGIALRHYVNKDIDSEIAENLDLIPAFDDIAFIPDNMKEDLVNKRIKAFRNGFEKILNELLTFREQYEQVSFYMYTSHPSYITANAELLDMPEYNKIDALFHHNLFYVSNKFALGQADKSYIAMLKEQANKLEKLDRDKKICIYSDSKPKQRLYQAYFKRDIEFMATAHFVEPPQAQYREQGDTITIGYFGYMTRKHGFPIIRDLLNENWQTRPGSEVDSCKKTRFILKINDNIGTEKFQYDLEKLKKLKNADVVTGFLKEDNYFELIDSCDIVIMPYLREEYPVQTSGIFAEAAMLGKVVIVPSDTWLSEMAKETGIGIAFRSGDARDLAEKLSFVINNLDGIKRVIDHNMLDNLKKQWLAQTVLDSVFDKPSDRPLSKLDSLLKRVNGLIEKYLSRRTYKAHFGNGNHLKAKNTADTGNNDNSNIDRAAQYMKLMEFKKRLRILKRQEYAALDRSKFLAYPEIENEKKLSELVNKIAFALPENGADVYVPVSGDLENVRISSLKAPDGQRNYLGANRKINLIGRDKIDEYFQDSRILLHDAEVLSNLKVLRNFDRVELVDKDYYGNAESCAYRILYYSTLKKADKDRYAEMSLNNYSKFLNINRDKKTAYCFATGPSFDKYSVFNFEENSLKVICNSAIKNHEFLNYIGGAGLLAFADPVFHFGTSEYAAKFRDDLAVFIERYDSFVIVPYFSTPLVLHYYPALEDRLIGMNIDPTKDYNFPAPENFYVKNSANILTMLMLPIASAVADNIYVLGADGRRKGEGYFWRHNKDAQYYDKLEGVRKVHPSFFKDRDYEGYFEEHCDFLEGLFQYGEGLGKTYGSLSPSFAPALENRYIGNFSREMLGRLKKFNKDNEHISEVGLVYNFAKKRDWNSMIYAGAHTGSTLKKFVKDGWQIHAFEPDDENRAPLDRKFGKEKNVIIDRRAVSDKTESGKDFYRSEVSTGISSLSSFHESHQLAQKVDTVSLTEYMNEKDIDNVDLLLIDTEGFDLFVLQGFPWEKTKPAIIVAEYEDFKTRSLGYDFYDMGDFLKDMGYEVIVSEWYPIVRYGVKHKWRGLNFYPCHQVDDSGWGNFIAIRSDLDAAEFLDLIVRS